MSAIRPAVSQGYFSKTCSFASQQAERLKNLAVGSSLAFKSFQYYLSAKNHESGDVAALIDTYLAPTINSLKNKVYSGPATFSAKSFLIYDFNTSSTPSLCKDLQGVDNFFKRARLLGTLILPSSLKKPIQTPKHFQSAKEINDSVQAFFKTVHKKGGLDSLPKPSIPQPPTVSRVSDLLSKTGDFLQKATTDVTNKLCYDGLDPAAYYMQWSYIFGAGALAAFAIAYFKNRSSQKKPEEAPVNQPPQPTGTLTQEELNILLALVMQSIKENPQTSPSKDPPPSIAPAA